MRRQIESNEQRVGRAARPGAARGWVQTYIPYIRGAGVEHIVSILSPRGAEHHAVLDSFEVVAANQLELRAGMPVPEHTWLLCPGAAASARRIHRPGWCLAPNPEERPR